MLVKQNLQLYVTNYISNINFMKNEKLYNRKYYLHLKQKCKKIMENKIFFDFE